MILINSEIDDARWEFIKDNPIMVVRTEDWELGMECKNCRGFIDRDHSSLMEMNMEGYSVHIKNLTEFNDGRKCPHCNALAEYEVEPISTNSSRSEEGYSHQATKLKKLPSKLVAVRKLILKEKSSVKTGWFSEKEVPEDYIVEKKYPNN